MFEPYILKSLDLWHPRNNICHRLILRFLEFWHHKLRTPGEEITFTAWPKINSYSQIFSYGPSIFCLPHQPKISDFFDLCLHWVSIVRALGWSRKTTKYLHNLMLLSLTTDTQWRYKSKKSEILGWCGRQNMIRPYLKIWDLDLIFGRAVKAISSPGVRGCYHLT